MKAPCRSSCCPPTCGCCRCPTWWCSGWRRPAPTGASCFSFRTRASLRWLVWKRKHCHFLLRVSYYYFIFSCESLCSSSQVAHTWVPWRLEACWGASQQVSSLTRLWPKWVSHDMAKSPCLSLHLLYYATPRLVHRSIDTFFLQICLHNQLSPSELTTWFGQYGWNKYQKTYRGITCGICILHIREVQLDDNQDWLFVPPYLYKITYLFFWWMQQTG